MNYVFISPNFPKVYSHFVKALHDRGVNVLGIGDEPYEFLNDELKQNLTEYCHVVDMNRLDWMKDTVRYLKDKYGPIDYIESNNEYWMMNDAKLREEFDVINGYQVEELLHYRKKSSMKEYFSNSGVKTARYIIASSYEESLRFAEEVGYPLFAKPDEGVGASATYKIENNEDLERFHQENLCESYIIEEYIEGYIISFDGIANKNNEVVISFNEVFPTPIAEVVTSNKDVFYYSKTIMNDDFRNMGERVVKAFNISSRCFHIEFFVLTKDKEGLGEKGDIVGLEVNLRSPGGNTSDMLDLVSLPGYYNSYADMIVNQIGKIDNLTNKIAISVNRKKEYKYIEDEENIKTLYGNNIVEHGFYPPLFRDAMGDEYYIGLFNNLKMALLFERFVHNKK